MAVGRSLAIPRLDGVAAAHRYSGGDRAAINLARALMELDLGAPEDWKTAKYEPTKFVELSLARWIGRNGGEAIRRRFGLEATICSDLDEYAERREGDPDGKLLYLTVESDTAAYVVLGPVLQLLNATHPQLAVSFHEVFTGALKRWLRIYDYREAQDRVAMWREWMESEADQGQYEIPDVDGCVPECVKREPLSRSEIADLALQAEGREVGALVNGIMELAEVSESAECPPLTSEAREQLVDSNPPLPGLLAVFHENDAIEACFDDDMQNALEAEPEPSFIIPLNANDTGSVRAGFEVFGVACQTIALVSRLIDLMPANEQWTRYDREETYL